MKKSAGIILKVIVMFAVLVCLMSAVIGYLVYGELDKGQKFFFERAKFTKSFEKTYSDLISEVPPPNGAKETLRKTKYDGYGVEMRFEYQSGPLLEKEVSDYYLTKLKEKGFTLKGDTFIKNPLCLLLENHIQSEHVYYVDVWSDYRNNPYGFDVPADWVIAILSPDNKQVLRCPR